MFKKYGIGLTSPYHSSHRPRSRNTPRKRILTPEDCGSHIGPLRSSSLRQAGEDLHIALIHTALIHTALIHTALIHIALLHTALLHTSLLVHAAVMEDMVCYFGYAEQVSFNDSARRKNAPWAGEKLCGHLTSGASDTVLRHRVRIAHAPLFLPDRALMAGALLTLCFGCRYLQNVALPMKISD